MKKRFFTLLLNAILLSLSLSAQIKVFDVGKVNIGAAPTNNRPSCELFVYSNSYGNGLQVQLNNPNAWASAIGATVPQDQSASYNLWNTSRNGSTMFYVTADGAVNAIMYLNITSDSSIKRNISKINDPLNILSNLHGYTFNFKSFKVTKGFDSGKTYLPDTGLHYGVIAQEVKKVMPQAVRFAPHNNKLSVDYIQLIPLLIEGTNELNKHYLQTANDLVVLQSKFNRLMSNIDSSSGNYTIKPSNPSIDFILAQNSPNPWNQDTKILYQLKGNYTSAYIYIFDLQGGWKKTYNLANYSGSVTIKSSDLQPGMYLYSLVVDGKEIDIKRMLLTN